MKKSKRVLAGAGLIMSLSVLTSCSLIRPMSLVYGPPEDMGTKKPVAPTPNYAVTEAPVTEEPDWPAPVYGPPEYDDPDKVDPEWPEDVYGPPEWFEEQDEENPAEFPVAVYGPPEWFDDETER